MDRADLDFVLERTEPVWRALKGGRLFVTGGSGFFGRWLLSTLLWANRRLDAGIEVVALSRSPGSFGLDRLPGDPQRHIQLLQGDVRWFEFPKGEFSHIVHAATDTGAVALSRPANYCDEIVNGTRRVLEFASHTGVKQLLYTSSGAVYGDQPATLEAISEEYRGACDPLDPRSLYGESKRMAEQLCATFHRQCGVEAKVARCFAFIGPEQSMHPQLATANFIRDAVEGERIVVQGDGTPVRSYLYAADLAAWLWTLLAFGQPCRPYNVGSDVPVSIAELARLIRDELAPAKEVRIAGAAQSGAGGRRYLPSIERARRELGLEVWTDLRTAVKRSGEWYRGRAAGAAGRPVQHGAERPKTLVVDFDGVLASLVPDNDYALATPLTANIAAINRLFDAGHRIILFTARGSATGIDWRAVTERQCAEWGVSYHELRFGKPAADYYIDDRMLSIDALHGLAESAKGTP